MGDSPVKDFFDLDMKDKMRIIESRKKLEKELIRVVYAPILLTCKAGIEKRFNDELTAIATVAEEDVQVVGKQLDRSMVGQFPLPTGISLYGRIAINSLLQCRSVLWLLVQLL